MTRKIQHKRGLEANLPQLDVAEIAFTTDSKKPFIGSADGNVEIAKKADVDTKASKTELTNAVSPKADKTYVDTELGKKASTDEVSAVSAQLADTSQEVETVKTTKADKAEVNTELSKKRDKTTPIGLNDAGSDLLTAIQGGTTVEVLSIPRDQSVTPNKTTFIHRNKENLYDPETSEDGVRIGGSTTPSISADANYTISAPIEVQPGTYRLAFPNKAPGSGIAVGKIATSTAEGDLIANIHNGNAMLYENTMDLTISESGYIRISLSLAEKDSFVIAELSNYKGFVPAGYILEDKFTAKPKKESVGVEELKDGVVTEKKTTFLSVGKNLFNKKEVYLDRFLNGLTVTTLAGYDTTEYIPVKGGVSYTLHPVRFWTLANEDKTEVIDYENTGSNQATRTVTPTVDGYLRASFSHANLDVFQIEEGTEATEYEPYGVKMPNLILTEDQKGGAVSPTPTDPTASGSLKIEKDSGSYSIKSPFGDNQEISIDVTQYGSRNGAFNFERTTVDGTAIHTNNDDITPIRTFTTVGANHGYTSIIQVTMTSHGKTTADLGSQWTDGTTTYTLLRIDGNVLTFGCPYTVNSKGVVSSSYVSPKANLTHVSGATNTAEVNVSNTTGGQLYPSINRISVKFLLDGKEITENGTHYGEELQVLESYNIMDYKSIIDYAQANIGTSFADGDIEGVVRLTNTYTFTKGGKCSTSHGFLALKPVTVGNCGFLQSISLSASGYTRKRFMPNVLPVNGYDFANGVDLDAYNTSTNIYAGDLVDPAIPPSHYVDWLYGSSGNKAFGFTMGYIVDKTNAKNADRLANTTIFWDLRSTTKSYPVAISGKTFESGDYMSFQGFRNYLSPQETGGATSFNVVKDKKDTYLYSILNEQVNGISKEMPDEIGENVNLIQSHNLTALNEIVDSSGVVMSATDTTANGVFKLG